LGLLLHLDKQTNAPSSIDDGSITGSNIRFCKSTHLQGHRRYRHALLKATQQGCTLLVITVARNFSKKRKCDQEIHDAFWLFVISDHMAYPALFNQPGSTLSASPLPNTIFALRKHYRTATTRYLCIYSFADLFNNMSLSLHFLFSLFGIG
jgi:hypothetical protein